MIREFLPSDLPEINRWYRAHAMSEVPLEYLPPTGRIVPGVAVGFLFLTDSAFGFLEGYIANADAPLRARSDAVDAITRELRAEAKRKGVQRLLAICATRGIERRAQKFGMRTIGVFAMAAGGVD